jgi:putative ABC transport system permease protein
MKGGFGVWIPDLQRSVDNLLLNKIRSLLTMLGMIFGVAAVLSMLSIGAGAQQRVMAFIEDLGVRNLIVESKETTDRQAWAKIRQQSPGLTFQDVRAMQATVAGVEAVTPRKRFTPNKLVPKPQGDTPVVYGVQPNYLAIGGLRVISGRFFSDEEASRAAPLCVLGEAARTVLFGVEDPLGKFVKVNDQWFRVIGAAGPAGVGLGRSGRDCRRRIATTSSTCRPAPRFSGSKTTTAGCATRSMASICG